MATEIELKLSLPAAAVHKLAAHPLLLGKPYRRLRLENTYYDTPQLDLLQQLVAVRWRRKNKEWLLTVKSAEPASGGLACRSEWESPATPGTFDFAMVDDKKLRRRLEKHAPALTPIFTTHFTRQAWQLEFAGARIELALDRGRIANAGRHTPICEIELELLDGDIAALFALARALQNDIPLHPSTESKAERGYALFKNAGRHPCKAAPCIPEADSGAVIAFRSMALNCLDQLQRNEAGVRRGLDPEYLHQARVALRRLRSCLKFFAPLLPAEFVAHYNAVWRDFANSLNAARNWDVFESEFLPPLSAAFPNERSVSRLRAASARAARAARRQTSEQFAAPDYSCQLLEFTAALFALPEHTTPSLAEFSRQRLQLRARQARRLARRLPQLNDGERHRLRITYKKLRYALEFVPQRKGRKPYLAILSHLQEGLGKINDHATALELLERLLPATQPGLIHGWIVGRQALLIAELPLAIKRWLAQRSPWKYS